MVLFPPANANISLFVGIFGNHFALQRGLSPCEWVVTQVLVSKRQTFALESWDLKKSTIAYTCS